MTFGSVDGETVTLVTSERVAAEVQKFLGRHVLFSSFEEGPSDAPCRVWAALSLATGVETIYWGGPVDLRIRGPRHGG